MTVKELKDILSRYSDQSEIRFRLNEQSELGCNAVTEDNSNGGIVIDFGGLYRRES